MLNGFDGCRNFIILSRVYKHTNWVYCTELKDNWSDHAISVEQTLTGV